MQKIIFVCTGNTCRSPMAEKLLNKHLKAQDVLGVKVDSRGLRVNLGENINDLASTALKAYKIRCSKRLAKQLKKSDIKPSTLFVTMTSEQKSAFPKNARVFSLDDIVSCGEIVDPYGDNQEKYNKVAEILNEATYKLAIKLKQLTQGDNK